MAPLRRRNADAGFAYPPAAEACNEAATGAKEDTSDCTNVVRGMQCNPCTKGKIAELVSRLERPNGKTLRIEPMAKGMRPEAEDARAASDT